MKAGLAMLDLISAPGFYDRLTEKLATLLSGLQQRADAAGVPFTTAQVGAMFGIFFTDKAVVRSYAEATACNVEHFKVFFHAMLDEGVYLAPSAFEAGFISSAHTDDDIQRTLAAAERAFARVAAL